MALHDTILCYGTLEDNTTRTITHLDTMIRVTLLAWCSQETHPLIDKICMLRHSRILRVPAVVVAPQNAVPLPVPTRYGYVVLIHGILHI